MTVDLQNPRLPQELERLIFMDAAYGSVFTASTLVLVAKRVQAWVDPILYRIIMLDEDFCWPPFKRLVYPSSSTIILSMLEKYGKHVHHLHICDTRDDRHKVLKSADLARCLDFCPNVTDLAIWARGLGFDLLNVVGKMKLQKLSACLEGFEHYAFSSFNSAEGVGADDTPVGDGEDDGSGEDEPNVKKDSKALVDLSTWQNSLTHLELVDEWLPPWKHFTPFLQSLHSLEYIYLHGDQEDDDDVRAGVLREAKSLKALVFTHPMSKLLEEAPNPEDEDDTDEAIEHSELKLTDDPFTLESRILTGNSIRIGRSFFANEDPRLVLVFSKFEEDWLKAALGGKDLWGMADEAVEKEREKQVMEKVLNAKRMEALAAAKAKKAAAQAMLASQPASTSAPIPTPASTSTSTSTPVASGANGAGNGNGSRKKRKKKGKKGKRTETTTD